MKAVVCSGRPSIGLEQRVHIGWRDLNTRQGRATTWILQTERGARIFAPQQKSVKRKEFFSIACNWSERPKGMTMSTQTVQLDLNQRSTESRDFEAALRRMIVGQDEAVQAAAGFYPEIRPGPTSPSTPR